MDSDSGITTTYYYDMTGRLAKFKDGNDDFSRRVEYFYNDKNQLTIKSEFFGTVRHNTYTLARTFLETRMRKEIYSDAVFMWSIMKCRNKVRTIAMESSDSIAILFPCVANRGLISYYFYEKDIPVHRGRSRSMSLL